MNIKKKNFIFCLVGMFIFACLFTCGIFAVVTKSVSFNLALKLDPKIYFALELQIDYNGDGDYADTQNGVNESATYKIFNNKTGADVVSWATVNQNCIVLNQVLAGNILSDLNINSKFKITVTNLTEKTSNEAEEYLHLTLDYDNQKEVFKVDNGYGAVNMECGVASGDTSATKSFTLIPQTTLLDGYIQIPFLAEIDSYRYTATITTENCEVVHARKTFKLGESYRAEFRADKVYQPIFNYDVMIGINSFNPNTNDAVLEIPFAFLTDNLVISVSVNTNDEDLINEVWDGSVATKFAFGDGSEDNPFRIYNPKQLALMAYLIDTASQQAIFTGTATMNNKTTKEFTITCDSSVTFDSANYVIMNDLVMNENSEDYETWETTPPANSWHACGVATSTTYSKSFSGVINGKNNNVFGIYLYKSGTSSDDSFKGFLGVCTGEVQQLNIKNSYINAYSNVGGVTGTSIGAKLYKCSFHGKAISRNSSSENTLCGGLAGFAKNESIMENCINYGDVKGVRAIGGIVGYHYSSLIQNCYNFGNIISTSERGGGLCGYSDRSQVINCFNKGTIQGSSKVGGISGDAYSTKNSKNIENCYNLSSFTGSSNVAGICGYLYGGAVLNNCINSYNNSIYSYNSSSTITNCLGLNSLTADRLQQIFFSQDDTNLSITNLSKTSSLVTSLATGKAEAYVFEFDGKNWYKDGEKLADNINLQSTYGITLSGEVEQGKWYRFALFAFNAA